MCLCRPVALLVYSFMKRTWQFVYSLPVATSCFLCNKLPALVSIVSGHLFGRHICWGKTEAQSCALFPYCCTFNYWIIAIIARDLLKTIQIFQVHQELVQAGQVLDICNNLHNLSGFLFQHLITLIIKKKISWFTGNQKVPYSNLCLFPLDLPLCTFEKSLASSSLHPPIRQL